MAAQAHVPWSLSCFSFNYEEVQCKVDPLLALELEHLVEVEYKQTRASVFYSQLILSIDAYENLI